MSLLKSRWSPVICAGLAAGALSAAQLALLPHDPFFRVPTGDAGQYRALGLALASGRSPAGAAALWSPALPLLHAALARLFGEGIWPYHVLATLAGIALAMAVPLAALRLAGTPAAWIAGALWVLYPAVFFFQAEPVFAIWAAGGTVLLFLLLENGAGSAWRIALSGLVIGALGYGQTNLLVYGPLAAAWLILEGRRDRGRGAPRRTRLSLPPAALLVGCTVLALLPAALYNRSQGSHALLPRGTGGIVFYVGNDLQSAGVFHYPRGFGDGTSYEDYHETSRRVASARAGRELSIEEADTFYYRQGWAELQQRGLRGAVRLQMQKAFMMVGAEEIPIHRDHGFADQWVPFRKYLPLGFAHLVGFAFLAIPLARGSGAVRLLFLLVGGVIFSAIPFYASDRFRFPAAPLLAMLSGAGLAALPGAIKRSPARSLIGLALALALIGVLHVRFPLPHRDRLLALEWERLGALYANSGRFPEAATALDTCLALDGGRDNCLWMRARVALALGDRVGACVRLEALARAPGARPEWIGVFTEQCRARSPAGNPQDGHPTVR